MRRGVADSAEMTALQAEGLGRAGKGPEIANRGGMSKKTVDRKDVCQEKYFGI